MEEIPKKTIEIPTGRTRIIGGIRRPTQPQSAEDLLRSIRKMAKEHPEAETHVALRALLDLLKRHGIDER